MKQIDHGSQFHFTYDQDVDVAARLGSSLGKGPVDECCVYSVRQRRQRTSDNVCCAGRLAQYPRDFFEDRTGSVGAIKRLIAASLAPQQPRIHETIQLADHCPRWQASTPRDLASMQRLIRREQQQTQHTAPVSGEKNGCEGLLHNSQRLSPF